MWHSHATTAMTTRLLEESTTDIESKFEGLVWNHGNIHNYVGMTFIFNRDNKTVGIKMEGYINDLISKYNINGKSKTPCGIDLFDIDTTSPVLEQDNLEKFH